MFTRCTPRCHGAPPLQARSFGPRSGVRGASLVARAFAPPPVSETKSKFIKAYDKPIPAMYETVLQELLVQQHFLRYNKKYQYDEIFALGLVSVFDQVLSDMDEAQAAAVFSAYISALGEKPEQYRKDAAHLVELASGATAADLKPDTDGNELQKVLAKVASRTASGEFFYSRFFAIGIFRLLEITNTRDPKALEALVEGVGVKLGSVNKDLLLYKSILSKMTAARELMREFLERERRKQAERDAAKAGGDSTGASEGAAGEDGAKVPESAKASS